LQEAWRYLAVTGVVFLVAGLIGARLIELHVLDQEFLRSQGEQRTLRTEPIDANRGVIRDRNGEPLAVSTPVETLWANPSTLSPGHPQLGELAGLLDRDPGKLRKRLAENQERQFLYLRRKVQPSLAEQVLNLDIPGIHSRREYRRYYPAGKLSPTCGWFYRY